MKRTARKPEQLRKDCAALASAWYEYMTKNAAVFCATTWVSPAAIIDRSGAREAALSGTAIDEYVMPPTSVLDQIPEPLLFVTAQELGQQLDDFEKSGPLKKKTKAAPKGSSAGRRQATQMRNAFEYLSARYYTQSAYVGTKDQRTERAVIAEVRRREECDLLGDDSIPAPSVYAAVAARRDAVRFFRDGNESSIATGRTGAYYPEPDEQEWAHFVKTTGISNAHWFSLSVPERYEIISEYRKQMQNNGTVVGYSGKQAIGFGEGVAEERLAHAKGSAAYRRAQDAAERDAAAPVDGKARRACSRVRACEAMPEDETPFLACRSRTDVCRLWFGARFRDVCTLPPLKDLPICAEAGRPQPNCDVQFIERKPPAPLLAADQAAREPAPAQSASDLPAEVSEMVSPGQVQESVAGKMGALRDCLARQQAGEPGAHGEVTVSWDIEPDGRPSAVAVDKAGNQTFAQCLVGVVRSIRFPKSRLGNRGEDKVRFPFKY